MKFKKRINRINEDFENLAEFFDYVKKEFKRDYNVRVTGIPGGGGMITLETKSMNPFTPDFIHINIETDPLNIKDFSDFITLHLNFNYDLEDEKIMLRNLRNMIDEIDDRLRDCRDSIIARTL